VTCSSFISILVSYSISLSAGNSGNSAARELRQSANILNYNLYSDPLRSSVWGSGGSSVSDSFLLSILGIGVDRLYPIYGRIPAGQINAPAGSYSDSITVTVAY
jgi:spore coat protein U-like protein